MQESISEKSKFSFFKIKNYWRNVDKQILVSFFLLFILGSFFSFSSTSFLADERLSKEYYFFFQKHFLYASISFSIMIFISALNTDLINKSLLPIFLIFFIILMLVPFVGIEIKGAKRWLNFFSLRFQPIEFIKPFFVLIIAQIIGLKWIKNMNLSYFISFILLSAIVLLLILQPDLGQSILLICTWISLIFVSGVNILFLFLLFIFVIFLFLILLYLAPEKFSYIITRITSFFDPTKTNNSQSQKAIEAIKQGGLKGEGMGEGILKESVPEAHTDYIIAVISEEFGSIVSIFVISIFLFIAFRIVKKIINSSNNFYKLSLCGLSSLLVFQTFIHVGVNANLLPTTGMTLPFLSYGGSSLLSSGVLAGVILNYTSLGVKN
jgi:cell division protein FtsW